MVMSYTCPRTRLGLLTVKSVQSLVTALLEKISEFRIPFTFESGYAYLVGSCNGLLCLTDSWRYSLGNNAIYLWNPSIRKYKRLPGTCLSHSDCLELGFAYDFQNNDYKVVRISQPSSKGMPPLQFEVYTLRLDSWKRIGLGILWRPNVLSYNFKCYFSCSFVSRHVHWMLDIFEEVAGQPKPSEMILSFDVNSEKFKELPLPKDDSFIRDGFETCLTMFKGKLALIQFGLVQQYGPHVMQCWVMREYGLPESWKKFCVVLVESPTNFVGFTKYGSLLFQTKSEPKKEDKFLLVDPKTQYKKDNIHLKYPLEVTLLNLATYMENITYLMKQT